MMSCRTSKENWNLFGPEVQGREVTWLPLSLCVAEKRGKPISPDSLDGQRRERLAAGMVSGRGNDGETGGDRPGRVKEMRRL